MATSRTVRVGPSGRIMRQDLPHALRKLKMRFSHSAEPPDRETSRFVKKDLREMVEGPGANMPVWISFYTDGNGTTPTHHEMVNIQWIPLPPLTAEDMPGDWPVPDGAIQQTRSVAARLKMVDHNGIVTWDIQTVQFTACPGDAHARGLLTEVALDALQCPKCAGDMIAIEIERRANCTQCGLTAKLSVVFDVAHMQAESKWASLWNGGYAYQGIAWQGEPRSIVNALNRPESIPEYREWKFVGEAEEESEDEASAEKPLPEFDEANDMDLIDDMYGDEEEEQEEGGTSPDDFARMAPSARICTLDMLDSSMAEDLQKATITKADTLARAAHEWGPALATRQLAYRSDPAFDNCPTHVMSRVELEEVTTTLSSHLPSVSVRDALIRGVRLARTYRGMRGIEPFGPEDDSLVGWTQWRELPSWARTLLRCGSVLTRAVDPDGDIRQRYEEYEVIDTLCATDDHEEGRPLWSDLIRQAHDDAGERFERDTASKTLLMSDDPSLLTSIASGIMERRRGYRDHNPVNARRVLRKLNPQKEDHKLASQLGMPLTKAYPEQSGTMFLVEEKLGEQHAKMCGVSRRLRVAKIFHSVNRHGYIQRRRDDGEPTGAHDVWLSRFWWPFPEDG